MKSISLFFFIFFTALGNAQDYLYQFPNKIPGKYQVDAAKNYQEFLKEPYSTKKQREISHFSEYMAYYKQNCFKSGNIYFNWNELESYLNKVMAVLMPDSLKEKKVHVYPARMASVNAFALHDGTILFNVGLLSKIENEASIAIILGHELAHFIYRDVKSEFFNGLKQRRKRNRTKLKYQLEKAHGSRFHEKRADSLGFQLAKDAGYDLSAGLSNFDLFEEEEAIYSKKKIRNSISEGTENSLRSHPAAAERREVLLKKINKKKENGKSFLVDSSAYCELKMKATNESIKILFDQGEYEMSLMLAFTNYLFYPQNDFVLYTLVESIRRITYLYPKIAEKPFLEDQFMMLPSDSNIFADISLLIPNLDDHQKIKAFNLDRIKTNPPFMTYEDALMFFGKEGTSRNLTEVYLSMALHFWKNEKLKDKYLSRYLEDPNAKFPVYAKSFRNNSLPAQIKENEKELVLLDNVTFFEDHNYGYYTSFIESEVKSPQINKEITAKFTKKFPGKDFQFLDTYLNNNFAEYVELKKISSDLASKRQYGEKESENIVYYGEGEKEKSKEVEFSAYILNPSVWTFFNRHGINTLGFLSIKSFDDQTRLGSYLAGIGFNMLALATLNLGYMNSIGLGSMRYHFDVSYVRYNGKNQKVESVVNTNHYKMSRKNMLHIVYQTLNENYLW